MVDEKSNCKVRLNNVVKIICNRRETWVEEYYVHYKECIEKRVTY